MRYQRNPAVTATEVDGEFFLVEPDSGEIYYLDVLSSALWRLLEAPVEERAALATLKDAFPDTDDGQIERDLHAVLADLRAKKLIEDTV